MKTLWTFGCSFTAEYEPIDGVHYPFENNYDRYKKWKGGTLPKVWPTLLAERLGYKIMNCGIGGSSNYNIFSQFINVCHLIEEDDILIFGWTQMARFMAANLVENKFNQILPVGQDHQDLGMGKNTIEEILVNRTNRIWATEVHGWIHLIETYVKKVGAEVYHWSSDDKIFNIEDKIAQEMNFIVVRDPNILYNDLFKEKHNMMWYLTHCAHYGGERQMGKIIDETDGLIPDTHMGQYGHEAQCQVFYTHIKEYTKIKELQ